MEKLNIAYVRVRGEKFGIRVEMTNEASSDYENKKPVIRFNTIDKEGNFTGTTLIPWENIVSIDEPLKDK